jgi:HPt (histidine-containing phosphotransfer) domain-containing protein
MDFDCSKLDDALREDEPELLAAARVHAKSCEACRAELRSWDELSAAARDLHREWDSPELWDRIDAALPACRFHPVRFHALNPGRTGWRIFLSAAAVLLLTVSSLWLLRRPATPRPMTTASRQFLTEQALKEAQVSEAAYVRSIDNLARLAEPVLDQSPSPLMANYREKLTVLDAAIADLKDNLERNRLNARLSTELVSLYHEKQQTLQEVLHHATQSN